MNRWLKAAIVATPPRALHPINGLILTLLGHDNDTKKLIQKRWNRDAMDGWGKYTWPGRPCEEDLQIYQSFLTEIKPQRILILGATPELRDLVATFTREPLTLVDLSLPMLSETTRFLRKADIRKERWYFANWLSLPFQSGLYDAVIGDYAVRQVKQSDRAALIREIHRVLVTGGFFLTRNHYLNPRWRNMPLASVVSGLENSRLVIEEMKQVVQQRLYDRWFDAELETFSVVCMSQDEELLCSPANPLRQFHLFDVIALVQKYIHEIQRGKEPGGVRISRRWAPVRSVFYDHLVPYFLLSVSRCGSRGEDHEWSPIELFQKK